MRANGALYPLGLFPFVLPLHQRPDRTDVQASATKFTTRLQQRTAEGGAYQGLARPFGKADSIVASYLFANSNAAAAGDAQVVVPVVKRVADLQRDLAILEINFWAR